MARDICPDGLDDLERFSYRKRPWCPVSAVIEEAASILKRDPTERPVGGIEQRLSRSGLRLPQDARNLGERLPTFMCIVQVHILNDAHEGRGWLENACR